MYRNLFVDFCFLTSHCLKLRCCIIFAYRLFGLLLFDFQQALLCAHDTVAQKDFEPTLPPLPDNIPENEEAMRIVCLVKNNQPLVRELSDACQIILSYTSIDNTSQQIDLFSGMSQGLCAFLPGFYRPTRTAEVGKGLRRPSSPAQCGYDESRMFSALSAWVLNIGKVFLSCILHMQIALRAIPFDQNRKEGETERFFRNHLCLDVQNIVQLSLGEVSCDT